MTLAQHILTEAAAMSGSKAAKAAVCAENAVQRFLKKFRRSYSVATAGIYAEVYSLALRIIPDSRKEAA